MTPYLIGPKMRRLLKAPLILLFLAALIYTIDSVRWTPPIPGGIAELRPITVNGSKQWLLIRGENKNAPVLLFLHSGPGAAQMAAIRPYQKELEKKFIVVQWDQRGAGLSDFPEDDGSLTVEQFTADGIKVAEYLKEQFTQDKIFLAGHGWGSALGWLMARDYPQHFKAFASLGQMAGNQQAAQQYAYTLGQARALQNQAALTELEALGPPPWPKGAAAQETVFKWIKAFKGASYAGNGPAKMLTAMALSTEYRIGDVFGWRDKYQKGRELYFSAMGGEVDLLKGGAEFQVPFYMILGERDLLAPVDVAAELYETIKAPGKKLIIYKDCAHFIMWERPNDYQAALIRLFGVY